MINHVRTVILNKHTSVAGVETGLPNAEFIDSSFIPVAIPQAIKPIRTCLYPDESNITNMLLRTKGIMRLIHQPNFDKYIREPDSRIAYSLTDELGEEHEEWDVAAFITSLNTLLLDVRVTTALFNNPSHLTSLDNLRQVWASGSIPLTSGIAAIVAYAFKCGDLTHG